MSVNPEPANTARMRSGSARANGPGAPGGGVGMVRPAAMASRKSQNHSLRVGSCQTSCTNRPPGRSAAAMLRKAATTSAKNIVPVRLIATSNTSRGIG